ncbi:guanine nucleotide-binding protein G(I)/G(S)/G(O) subunit gamma-7 isoform X1 [Ciconia boyciana]|uniref:guanine nucleotide-binding protein G(I)/G(S)/G(O) subunit gamma-7 isoform X1 n=1 Tax=Ciconia boyciana TaxID=52775 RepID=UPI003BA06D23
MTGNSPGVVENVDDFLNTSTSPMKIVSEPKVAHYLKADPSRAFWYNPLTQCHQLNAASQYREACLENSHTKRITYLPALEQKKVG